MNRRDLNEDSPWWEVYKHRPYVKEKGSGEDFKVIGFSFSSSRVFPDLPMITYVDVYGWSWSTTVGEFRKRFKTVKRSETGFA